MNIIIKKESDSFISTNSVLKNTYLLLSLTLIFGAFMAFIAIITNASHPNFILMLVGFYGLLFLTQYLRNSIWGLLSVFAFTGFLGYSVGPIINFYLGFFSNGTQIVMTSLGGTGLIFLTLSAYVLTTNKNFDYLTGFMITLSVIAVFAMTLSIFFSTPYINIFISGIFMLISSLSIIHQTSLLINGGERNYIMATINLYVSLYNLFLSLMQLLAAFGGSTSSNNKD